MFSSFDEDEERPVRKKTRPYYLQREMTGAYATVFEPLMLTDPHLLIEYIRMSATQFGELFAMVGPYI